MAKGVPTTSALITNPKSHSNRRQFVGFTLRPTPIQPSSAVQLRQDTLQNSVKINNLYTQWHVWEGVLINVRTIYAVHTTLDGSSDITSHRTQVIIYKHCHLNQQIVNHFSHNLIPTIVKYAHSFHSWCALQLGHQHPHHTKKYKNRGTFAIFCFFIF